MNRGSGTYARKQRRLLPRCDQVVMNRNHLDPLLSKRGQSILGHSQPRRILGTVTVAVSAADDDAPLVAADALGNDDAEREEGADEAEAAVESEDAGEVRVAVEESEEREGRRRRKR